MKIQKTKFYDKGRKFCKIWDLDFFLWKKGVILQNSPFYNKTNFWKYLENLWFLYKSLYFMIEEKLVKFEIFWQKNHFFRNFMSPGTGRKSDKTLRESNE